MRGRWSTHAQGPLALTLTRWCTVPLALLTPSRSLSLVPPSCSPSFLPHLTRVHRLRFAVCVCRRCHSPSHTAALTVSHHNSVTIASLQCHNWVTASHPSRAAADSESVKRVRGGREREARGQERMRERGQLTTPLSARLLQQENLYLQHRQHK